MNSAQNQSIASDVMSEVLHALAAEVNVPAIVNDVDGLLDTVISLVPDNPTPLQGIERTIVHGLMTGFVGLVVKHVKANTAVNTVVENTHKILEDRGANFDHSGNFTAHVANNEEAKSGLASVMTNAAGALLNKLGSGGTST